MLFLKYQSFIFNRFYDYLIIIRNLLLLFLIILALLFLLVNYLKILSISQLLELES